MYFITTEKAVMKFEKNFDSFDSSTDKISGVLYNYLYNLDLKDKKTVTLK